MSSPDENSPERAPKTAEIAENSKNETNPEEPDKTTTGADVSTETRYFKTKKIRFGPLEYQIVTQNTNGPCPLIAIINALVLKGKVVIAAGETASSTELLTILTNFILTLEPPDNKTKETFEKNFAGVMNLMDKLLTGLNVNVKFSDVDAFEFTETLSLFDIVSLKLYHVWLPDPQFPEMYKLISSLNYNELTTRLVDREESVEWILMDTFHQDTKFQCTFHGLATLMEKMHDGELAVLFHNDHFSTIFKRRDEIFKLVSDVGYANEPAIVWETFSSVDGDCIFVNCDFGNFKPIPPPVLCSPGSSSSAVIRTSEIQEEIGEEALPTTRTPSTQTPPSTQPRGGNGGRPPHATVTPRQSQERKSDTKNNCSLM
ncbi:hypothetical protein CAEBREN_19038 [Caenorhabditis brenneri]|uniref:Ubiquitin carboxyl-terminal hydrolase n=1 Tax=Caenorhabditis brenneri TaxID=135651 RepID=G0NAE4_CAEBE|nr:hypothetical protein CAEBREN_19038 [Caenorhabditis brenneri]